MIKKYKMKKLRYWNFLIIIPVLGFIYSCSTMLIIPQETDAGRGKLIWGDYSFEDLKTGHRLYINSCASCHNLYIPSNYSAERWKDIMQKMGREAKLTKSEKDLITKYLIVMSKK